MSETTIAGKFRMIAWTDGFPVSIELRHSAVNGDEKTLRLFGTEELHELKFVVERTLAKLEKRT